MLGAVPGPGVVGGLPPSLKNYLKMVALETGTLAGACCEVAGNPAGMINPLLPVFGKQPGVLLQCQYDYLGGRGDPQVVGEAPHFLGQGIGKALPPTALTSGICHARGHMAVMK